MARSVRASSAVHLCTLPESYRNGDRVRLPTPPSGVTQRNDEHQALDLSVDNAHVPQSSSIPPRAALEALGFSRMN
ncbi:hypothetical protein GN956_G1656 [Arapaima gigas]